MWGFVDCTRYHLADERPQVVLFNASLVVETREKVALLIRPGQGKSTIMRMLAGIDLPDSGAVLRDEGGWPLGYAGGFHNDMSGEANVRNLAKLADVDPIELSAFCFEFSELDEFYHQPLSRYSSTMKARLALSASFGLPARTYLADDKLAAGDERFRQKCMSALKERLTDCGLIFIASNPRAAKDVCDRFYVVSGGEILPCDDYDHAAVLLAASVDEDSADAAEVDMPTFDLA
jgi:capsular polysaccharide transport system ATP-binding protein